MTLIVGHRGGSRFLTRRIEKENVGVVLVLSGTMPREEYLR